MIPNRRAHPATMEGVTLAAALVATADGDADRRERRGFLAFLSRHGLLSGFGRSAALGGFEREVAVLRNRDPAWAREAAERLRPLAGQPGARLAAAAAASVLRADGVAWPQELEMLALVRDRLGLASSAPR